MHLRLNFVSTSILLTALTLNLGGCFDDPTPGTSASGTEATSGDGDGDPATGDGDGDSTTTSGDGDGDETTTTTGDGDGDATTTGGACGAGSSCIVDPGPPWEGPFAVGDACSANSYGIELHELFMGFDPGDPNCACECGEPQVNCSTSMSVTGYSGTGCNNGQGSQGINEQQCYNTFAASHSLSLSNASAQCGPGDVVAEIPTPTFDVSLLGCAVSEPIDGGCEDNELCAPDPIEFQGGVCFSSPGDVTCPAGYPEKTVFATGFEDTRMCADECSCSATGATCQVSVTGFANANCSSGQGAIVVASGEQECVAANAQVVESIRPGNVTVQNAGACVPEGPIMFGGEAIETDPLTVCCTG